MRSRRLLVGLVLLVSVSGCQSVIPPGSDSEDTTSPQAELRGIETIKTECVDDTGLGQNTSIVLIDDGERVFINRTIKADSPEATLNASLHSVDSDRSRWSLQITSQSAKTDQSACISRIKYSATVKIVNTGTYRINITHNGKVEGNVVAGEDGSGGVAVGGGGSSEGHPTNNSST